jgi:hypothetical protein
MPGSDLRLLALDDGGVRGLSALMILKQLMEAVDPDAAVNALSPVHPKALRSRNRWKLLENGTNRQI